MRRHPLAAGALVGAITALPFAGSTGVVFGTLGGSVAEHYLGQRFIPAGVVMAILVVAAVIAAVAGLIAGAVAWSFVTAFRRLLRAFKAA